MLQLAAFLCSFPAVHKEAFGFFHFVCLQPEIRDLVILWLKKRNCLQIALIDWPVCVSMKQISKWSVLSVCDDRTATDRTSNNLSGLVDCCYIRADFQTQPPFFSSTKWFCFWKCFFLLLLFLILHYFRNNFIFFFFYIEVNLFSSPLCSRLELDTCQNTKVGFFAYSDSDVYIFIISKICCSCSSWTFMQGCYFRKLRYEPFLKHFYLLASLVV